MELEIAIEKLNEVIDYFYIFANSSTIKINGGDIIAIETILKELEKLQENKN